MTDVVTPPGLVSLPSDRLSRVRCVHCAMPARGTEDSCWSCGLDPTRPLAALEAQRAHPGGVEPAHPEPRWSRLVVSGLVVLLVAVLAVAALVAPGDDGQGVRGLAARLRGDGWHRAGIDGASAEFPAPPVRRSVPLGPGFPANGQSLVADTGAVRAELFVVDVSELARSLDGPAIAEKVLDAYAATTGGQVPLDEHMTVQDWTFAGTVIEKPGGHIHVMVTVQEGKARLTAVTGPDAARNRFTDSLRDV